MKKGDKVFAESHDPDTYGFLVNGKIVLSFYGILVGSDAGYSNGNPMWFVEPIFSDTEIYVPLVCVKESDISDTEYPY